MRLYSLLEIEESQAYGASYEDLELILDKLDPHEIKWELEQLLLENPVMTSKLINNTFMCSIEKNINIIRLALEAEGIYWEHNDLTRRQEILLKLRDKFEAIDEIFLENISLIEQCTEDNPLPNITTVDKYIFPDRVMELLTEYYWKFNGRIFEEMAIGEFLKLFRIEEKSSIVFKPNFKAHFKYSLSFIEKYHLPIIRDFNKWYSERIGGSYKNSKGRPKRNQDISDDIDLFFRDKMKSLDI
jgi:hypothetical protein